jgi:hypothetical protein
MLKPPCLAFLSLAATLCLALPLAAQSVNADVHSAFGTPPSTYGAAANQSGIYNNIDAGTVAPIPLVDLTGAPTGASMTHTGAFFNFSFDNLNTTGDDQTLMDDCQDIGGIGNSDTWTISGLSNGVYEIFIYAWGPDDPTNYLTDVTVAGGAAGLQTVGGADWSGSHVEGDTYARDLVTVTSGTLAFTLTTQAGFGSFNGFQLVDGASTSSTYCTAGTTSSGCHPAMSGSGIPSLSNLAPFTATVSAAEGNKNGVFFYSISGRNAAPWGNSTSLLCVKAPSQRMNPPLTTSGTNGACDGSMSIDWNAYVAANPGKAINQALTAGSTVGMQAWMRDPAAGTGPVGSKGTNLSDALEFAVFP